MHFVANDDLETDGIPPVFLGLHGAGVEGLEGHHTLSDLEFVDLYHLDSSLLYALDARGKGLVKGLRGLLLSHHHLFSNLGLQLRNAVQTVFVELLRLLALPAFGHKDLLHIQVRAKVHFLEV